MDRPSESEARPVVAFDESGNSGENLLDPEQPVFVLASVHVHDTDAKALLGGERRGGELKFGKLRRSETGRRRVLEVLNADVLGPDHVVVSAFHKPFMVITKMVDMLIEPLFHSRGIDLYERGANLGMANMYHVVIPTFVGAAAFDRLRSLFVEMVRQPTLVAIDAFYDFVDLLFSNRKHRRLRLDLGMLLTTRAVVEVQWREWDGADLDPAVPAFVEHGSVWTTRLQAAYDVIHDESKPILHQRAILEAMMSVTDETVTIGYDRRKMAFPIKATGIRFVVSDDFPQIQLADLVASACAYTLRARAFGRGDAFADRLLETRLLKDTDLRLVWPTSKVTPQELGTEEVGGIDANDYVGEYVARRLGTRR